MTTALFYAHSGLRYLVLLAALVAIGYAAFAWLKHRPADRAGRITGAAFTGLLDVQILIGLVLLVSGIYYGALIGHLVMMLLAAAAAHGGAVLARNAAEGRRAHAIRIVAFSLALLLIVGGIAAIGRGVLQGGAPSVVS